MAKRSNTSANLNHSVKQLLIPRPPPDASLLGLYHAYLLHEGPGFTSLQRTAQAFFGVHCCPFDVAPGGLTHIADNVLRGRMSARDLRAMHTLTFLQGVHAEYSEVERAMDRREQSPRPRTARSWKYWFRRARTRSCPACVAADLDRYGFAYLRATHQWPSLQTCTEHGVALEGACDSCSGTPGGCSTGWNQRPEMPCVYCGALGRLQSAVPKSPGYAAYVRVFAQLRWRSPATASREVQRLRTRYLHASSGTSLATRERALLQFFGTESEAHLRHLMRLADVHQAVQRAAAGQYQHLDVTWAIVCIAFYRWFVGEIDD